MPPLDLLAIFVGINLAWLALCWVVLARCGEKRTRPTTPGAAAQGVEK